MAVWVICLFLAVVWIHFLFSRVYNLGVELPGHVVIACLNFWGTSSFTFRVLYFHQPCLKVPVSLFLSNTCLSFFFLFLNIWAILVSMQWYLTVVLTWVSLMANDVEIVFSFLHVFIDHLYWYIIKAYLLRSFTHYFFALKNGLCLFSLLC